MTAVVERRHREDVVRMLTGVSDLVEDKLDASDVRELKRWAKDGTPLLGDADGLGMAAMAQVIADAEQRGAESAKAEAQPAGTGWVSVEERLPPTGCSVVVDGGAAYYDGQIWRTLMSAEHREIQWTVTHWMPWPKLPERDR